MILGGLFGFASGIVLGWLHHGDWPQVLWRATVAALVFGVLLRWWGGIWIRSLQAAVQQRMTELAAQRKEAKSNPPKRV